MNRKQNARFQRNDEKLRDAYLTLLDKYKDPDLCSIKEICSIANIHHTTFYGHYHGIDELADSVARIYEKAMNESFLLELKPEELPSAGIKAFIHFVYQNPLYFKLYVMHTGTGNIYNQCYTLLEKHMMPKLLKKYTEKEVRYRFEFTLHGFLDAVLYWVEKNECKDSEEEVFNYLNKIIYQLENAE